MDPAFAQHDTIFSNMIYMYSYSLYLFFDFAGYSSFVIGVSYMMGIKTPKTSISHSLVVILKTSEPLAHEFIIRFRDFIYMRFVFLQRRKS